MKSTGLFFTCILFCVTSFAQTKKIVFVCEHGSAKSVIAAAYFNKLAKEKSLPWEAVSRGTTPDQELSVKTKELLKFDNLLDTTFIPKQLLQADVDGADQVILFYDLPENIREKSNIQNWMGIEAVNNDFHKLRNDILIRITPLVDSLAKR